MHSLKHDRQQEQDAGVAPVPLASFGAVFEFSLPNHAVPSMPIWGQMVPYSSKQRGAHYPSYIHSKDMVTPIPYIWILALAMFLRFCKSELVQMQPVGLSFWII